MDRREAKDILSGYRLLLAEETDLRHALDLAIEALEKLQLSGETSTNTSTNTPTCNHTCNKKQVTGKLKNPCDSLLTADSDECKEQKSKLDCISRQQAIEAVEKPKLTRNEKVFLESIRYVGQHWIKRVGWSGVILETYDGDTVYLNSALFRFIKPGESMTISELLDLEVEDE